MWRRAHPGTEAGVLRICVQPEEDRWVTLMGDGRVHEWRLGEREEQGNIGWLSWEECPQ